MLLSKLKIAGILVLVVGFIAAARGQTAAELNGADPKPAAKEVIQPRDDHIEIRGTWEDVTDTTAAKTRFTLTPQGLAERSRVQQQKPAYIITDDKLMLVGKDGFLDEEITFKVDPTQTPKAINLTYRSATFLGIYQLEGDTLKVCYGLSPNKRPTEFPSSEPDPMIGKTERTTNGTTFTVVGRARTDMTIVLKRVSHNFTTEAKRMANAPGYFWIVKPSKPSASTSQQGVGYFYDEHKDGGVEITVAFQVTMLFPVQFFPSGPRYELRPVLLDAAGKRYLPEHTDGGSSSNWKGPIVALHRWRMDPNVLPTQKVARIGIEAVTADTPALRPADR